MLCQLPALIHRKRDVSRKGNSLETHCVSVFVFQNGEGYDTYPQKFLRVCVFFVRKKQTACD